MTRKLTHRTRIILHTLCVIVIGAIVFASFFVSRDIFNNPLGVGRNFLVTMFTLNKTKVKSEVSCIRIEKGDSIVRTVERPDLAASVE